MFEDKIEAMNKLPNAVDDSSGFEKRVYTVEEILFAGVFVDTVLDMTRERIIDFIIS